LLLAKFLVGVALWLAARLVLGLGAILRSGAVDDGGRSFAMTGPLALLRVVRKMGVGHGPAEPGGGAGPAADAATGAAVAWHAADLRLVT
jgi:hypothetical protein